MLKKTKEFFLLTLSAFIIAILIKKYTNFDIGRALFFTDVIITTFSFFIFNIKTGLFSIIGLTIKSMVIDSVIEDINLCKYFNIICINPEPICEFILNELHRSATICEGTSAFTHDEKYIIFTALNRYQALKLKHFLSNADPAAFILISNTSEIIGKGFHKIYN